MVFVFVSQLIKAFVIALIGSTLEPQPRRHANQTIIFGKALHFCYPNLTSGHIFFFSHDQFLQTVFFLTKKNNIYHNIILNFYLSSLLIFYFKMEGLIYPSLQTNTVILTAQLRSILVCILINQM